MSDNDSPSSTQNMWVQALCSFEVPVCIFILEYSDSDTRDILLTYSFWNYVCV